MYNGNNYTSKIGIDDLVKVLKVLKKNNFPNNQWDDLGLELGISYTKLEEIKANSPQNASGCLKGCLALWLQQDYSTEEYGKPTRESLAAALREMGLNGVASGIMGEP